MIVLVNPPNPPNAVSNKDTMGGLGQLYPASAINGFPPIDIPYAAAVLRQSNIPARVMECMGSKMDLSGLIVGIQDCKPRFTAIRTSTPTFQWDMRVARILKIASKTRIIVFGPHASIFPEQVLAEQAVDAVVIGEPEFALPDIYRRQGFAEVEGVWYKHDGATVQNPPRAMIENLDVLPFPAWDLLPYRSYEGGQLMGNKKPFVTILSSRGCPNGCFYCPYPVTQGRKWRSRSPESVVAEMVDLAEGLGVKAVLFRDPEFAFNRDRVTAICSELIRLAVPIGWRCETRIEDLDRELIALMARAGCTGINIGIESSDETVLAQMGRRSVPVEKAKQLVRTCRNNRIDAFCFFVLGLPGETRTSALKTIDYAMALNPRFIQFSVATPYPGTKLRAMAHSRGFIEDNSLTSITGYDATMRNEHMTVADIRKLQRLAHEARDLQWHKVVRRVLGHARGACLEVRRWLTFQREKAACRRRDW